MPAASNGLTRTATTAPLALHCSYTVGAISLARGRSLGGVKSSSSWMRTSAALLGADEGWVADFSRAVYLSEFGEGANIFDRNVLAHILSNLGVDAEGCLDEIKSPELKERLKVQTAKAQDLGIFGAPSFIAGGELFWGNDRLEQALDRARQAG